MSNLKQRYQYPIILLRQLVVTDFKLRYQSSFLGYLWSLLRPLMLFLILYIVFVKFIGIGSGIPSYPVYLLLGIVLWNFFSEITSGSVGSIVGRGDLLRKINFPKYVIVLAGSFSALINLFLNMLVVLLFSIVTDVDFRQSAVLLPLIIAELFVFAIALGFLLSAAFVRFRDINYIWEVIMQGAFYATPILYPLQIVPPDVAKIIMLNPVAQVIQDARYVFVTDETLTSTQVYGSVYWRAIHLGIIVTIVVVAVTYFRVRAKHFAEEV